METEPTPGVRTVSPVALRAVVVDDEPLARSRLRILLSRRRDVRVVGEAGDADEAIEAIEVLNPDILFLDIEMPGRNGLQLARLLRERPGLGVIFVTAHYQFAVEAFEIDAIDYLLKPVEPERLDVALLKAGRARRAADEDLESLDGEATSDGYANALWVQSRAGMIGVPLHTIDWIEAARDYVLLHTDTRSHILRATMTSLEQQLDPAVMVRVSRSAFVRRDAVRNLAPQGRGGLIAVLQSGAGVRVGATFVASVGRQFAHLLQA